MKPACVRVSRTRTSLPFWTPGRNPRLHRHGVRGRDRRRKLLHRRGRLTPRETVHVVAQICDALTYAHHHGVVHGDVSPSNILLRRADRVAKLVDFGLASRAAGVGSTRAAATHGTPGQVAPEVLWGAEPTPLSDLYCLGIVAYRFLAGPTASRDGEADATAMLPTAVAADATPRRATARSSPRSDSGRSAGRRARAGRPPGLGRRVPCPIGRQAQAPRFGARPRSDGSRISST